MCVCACVAQQQLDFLLRRRQQFVKAAMRSKQMKDIQGAAQHLRNAKGLDPMITAAKGGLPVDISKVCVLMFLQHYHNDRYTDTEYIQL